MTGRLSLTNANIERQKAKRIATEIFDAIHASVATKLEPGQTAPARQPSRLRLNGWMR
jgi:hypothetical protein